MKKISMITAILLISVITLIPLSAIGLRYVLLKETDCLTCRRIISLIFQPRDYNAPIAMSRIQGGSSSFYLFPNYVGSYFLEVYPASRDLGFTIVTFHCSEDIEFKATVKPSQLYSSLGHGYILGSLHILPKQLFTKDRIACELRINGSGEENMLLAIRRASEL